MPIVIIYEGYLIFFTHKDENFLIDVPLFIIEQENDFILSQIDILLYL